jgi:hypothetical protein
LYGKPKPRRTSFAGTTTLQMLIDQDAVGAAPASLAAAIKNTERMPQPENLALRVGGNGNGRKI